MTDARRCRLPAIRTRVALQSPGQGEVHPTKRREHRGTPGHRRHAGRLRQRRRRRLDPHLVHQPRLRGTGRDRQPVHRGGRRRSTRSRSPSCRGNPPQQREQLVRRLAAEDSSIDIMSLDPPYIPEFAEAGFLAPGPRGRRGDGSPRASSRAPSTARRGTTSWSPSRSGPTPSCSGTEVGRRGGRPRHGAAGHLGPARSRPPRTRTRRSPPRASAAEALTVWVNALIESGRRARSSRDRRRPADIELGLDTEAGGRGRRGHAQTSATRPPSGRRSPPPDEDSSVADFESGDAGFMVNWPFVWGRAAARRRGRARWTSRSPDDYGWAPYPRVVEGDASAPPLRRHQPRRRRLQRARRLRLEAPSASPPTENQATTSITNGNPAAKPPSTTTPRSSRRSRWPTGDPGVAGRGGARGR